jgi:hypothetical protein
VLLTAVLAHVVGSVPGEPVNGPNRFAFALVRPYVVGATGFEPVTSSVSANYQEPLC